MEVVHEASWCVCAEQDVLKAPTPPIIVCVCVCGSGWPCANQILVSLLASGLTSDNITDKKHNNTEKTVFGHF